jgi:molecular chaperone DnaK
MARILGEVRCFGNPPASNFLSREENDEFRMIPRAREQTRSTDHPSRFVIRSFRHSSFFMSPILGIDLGTTNSLVGVVDSGFPILLADEQGQRLTPSAVNFAADGSIIVGSAALRKRALEPKRTVTSVKRLIGRRGGEGDWQPPYNLRELGVSPIEVSAEILKRLKAIAERALEQSVSRAVITVPAYFNDAQRNATKQAGELAGLTVERIVSEPTAAALAYGLDKLGERQKIAVYDLGGGTFDISVLEMREGVFQVLSTAGDTQLGGDDIDRAIVAWLAEGASGNSALESQATPAAEAAKKRLSNEESTRIELPFYDGTNSLSVELTRAEFEKLIRPLVERTRAHCLRALSDAGVKPEELDAVILVGGSTRIPLVRRYVADIFGREPDISQNPDEAVALGAVIQAGILSGSLKNVLLLDVTPLSLGIETFGGLMNTIIPRNTTIPCKAGEMFTNAVANQQDMLIRVLQGERELAKDNWELGRVIVPFPPGPKGSARVGVQFAIDANGILQVLARDTARNTDTVLEIQNTAIDVDDERVEQMISESVEHAFEDMNERVWTEAKLKAEELLPAVDAALTQFGDAVSTEERAVIESTAAQVRALLHAAEHDAKSLKSANAALDDATQELAVRLVERAMEESLVRRGLV